MKYRNTANGIIQTFVKLSFLSMSVMRQICTTFDQHSVTECRLSRSLLGGREHQITHANVDIELNGV